MKRRSVILTFSVLVVSAGIVLSALAQEMKPMHLPEPKLDQAKSLAQALRERKSSREFRSDDLSAQTLSNLLWAAFGINRPDSGRRTAPSAYNRQEIDVYVVTREGVYLYDARGHALVPVTAGDIRGLTGTQAFVKDVPVNLVYVADLEKMGSLDEATKASYAASAAGSIGQNVYLYCASEGLATVYRALIDRERLAQAMKLRPDRKILFAQSVGLPKSGK